MIGLLFGLLHIGGLTAKGLSEIHEENSRKEWAIKHDSHFYMDRHGHMRHTENDQPYEITRDWKTGDVIEYDPYTGRTLKNLSRIERNKHTQEVNTRKDIARAEGKQYALYDRNDCRKPHYPNLIPFINRTDGYVGLKKVDFYYQDQEIYGAIWTDVETGGMYVRRNVLMHTKETDTKEEKNLVGAHIPVVHLDLTNGKLDPDRVIWGRRFKDQPVTEFEKERLREEVAKLNETDEDGRFINREIGVWMNVAWNYKYDSENVEAMIL